MTVQLLEIQEFILLLWKDAFYVSFNVVDAQTVTFVFRRLVLFLQFRYVLGTGDIRVAYRELRFCLLALLGFVRYL